MSNDKLQTGDNLQHDTVLHTADGRHFMVHACLVIGKSRFFAKLLETTSTNTESENIGYVQGIVKGIGEGLFKSFLRNSSSYTDKDENCTHVQIAEVSSRELEAILEHMYTDEISITTDNARQLFAAAVKLEYEVVAIKCAQFFVENLTANNCFGICNLLKLCSKSTHYQTAAYKFALTNFDAVIKGDEFVNLSLESVTLYLSDSGLGTANESDVWEAILIWIKHNFDERKCHLLSLVKCLRLSFFKKGFINNHLLRHPLIADDLQVAEYLFDEKNKKLEKRCLYSLIATVTPPVPNAVMPSTGIVSPWNWNIGGKQKPDAPAAGDLKRSDPKLGVAAAKQPSTKKPGNLAGNNLTPVKSTCGEWWFDAYIVTADEWRGQKVCPPKHSRINCCIAFAEQMIFVFGGMHPTLGTVLKSCESYSLLDDEWKCAATLPTPRAFMAATVIDSRIYCTGGVTSLTDKKQIILSDTLLYEADKNEWKNLSPMQMARCEHASTLYDGLIFVCGGRTQASNNGCNSFECYNPETNQWTVLSPMRTIRFGHCLVANGGFLLALAGRSTNLLNSCEKYNPKTDKWLPFVGLKHPKANFAAISTDSTLMAMGGMTTGNYLSTYTEQYDYNTRTWTTASAMPGPRAHSYAFTIKSESKVISDFNENK